MNQRSPFDSGLFRPSARARREDSESPAAGLSPLAWPALLALVIGVVVTLAWIFFGEVERLADGRGIVIRDSEFGIYEVAGLAGGQLAEVRVREGDSVEAGQIVATLRREEGRGRSEAERVIRSGRAGRVVEVGVSTGNVIAPGKTILRLESLTGPYEVLAYVSALEGKKIRPGMEVRLVPSTARALAHGHLRGRVNYVSAYPVTREYLVSELGGNERLADYLLAGGSSIEVDITIERDSQSGEFVWHPRTAEGVAVESGVLVEAFVVLERIRPSALIFPR